MPDVQESGTKEPSNIFPLSALPDGVGATIRAARLERRWSQMRLASRAHVARATVHRLEAGGHPIRPDTLFRLVGALGLEMRDVVPAWPEWDPVGGSGHGPRTRARRRALGMTIADLAAAARVSGATLSRHERGIGRSPELLKLVGDEPYACNLGLAEALGFVTLGEFEEYCRTGVGPAPAPADAGGAGISRPK